MTTTKLFIPSRLKVGFVHRHDTFLKTLSYIIYYDAKGVLRKETSWENWRDKSIEPIEVDNVPHSGFILNKDVQRYGWSYYSSGRSMIRVYDDRGMEFEVTPNNLLFILMNTNCFKRELEGQFVYAWDNKDLVLLPIGCEEYKASSNFTQLQGGKLLSKDMVPGCVYKTKKDVNLVYLGKFLWFDYTEKRNYFSERRYVFIHEGDINTPLDSESVTIESSTALTHLATKVTDSHIDNLAEKLEEFNRTKHSSPPVKLMGSPLTKEYIDGRYGIVIGLEKGDQVFELYNPHKYLYENGYYLVGKATLRLENGKLIRTRDSAGDYVHYYKSNSRTLYTIQELMDNFVRVKVELANGLEVNIKSYEY